MLGLLPSFYKFKVVDGTPLGRACVAKEKIFNEEIICKMTGPIIDLKQFFEKYDFNNCMPLQINRDQYIDLIEPYVCFNHSCKPNAGIRNNGILFAIQDIDLGKEITYDYSSTADDVLWSMECLCKEKVCRKIIGDFQSIPHLQKLEYLKLGCLPEYIRKTFY